MTNRPLTDEDVHDRLVAAVEALGTGEAETVRGRTAMETARRALTMLQLAILMAQQAETDQLPGVLPSTDA